MHPPAYQTDCSLLVQWMSRWYICMTQIRHSELLTSSHKSCHPIVIIRYNMTMMMRWKWGDCYLYSREICADRPWSVAMVGC